MKNQEPSKPTGNLEELFRHHLAEGAVPPRPQVWEQVDNVLLLAQNETYRRRLRVTRWVAAASLLLATLAGTGWWARRDLRPMPDAVPVAAGPARSGPARRDVASSSASVAKSASASVAAGAVASKPAPPVSGAASAPASQPGTTRPTPPLLAGKSPAYSTQTASSPARFRNPANGNSPLVARLRPTLPAPALLDRPTGRTNSSRPAPSGGTNGVRAADDGNTTAAAVSKTSTPTSVAGSAAATGAALEAARPDAARGTLTRTSSSASAEPRAATELAAGESAVWAGETAGRESAVASLPGVAASLVRPLVLPLRVLQPLPTPEAALLALNAPVLRRWQLGLAYSAGLFTSNVDFMRPESDYNPALGANSPALTRYAATEYQQREQPGLAQRLRLQLSRPLRGHWRLSSGLEVAQLTSRSTTSYRFTGEQIPDLSQGTVGGPPRETQARYRTVGLPLELSYGNPLKTGWSLYGRVGVVLSTLLSARTEVAGIAEATRTYGPFSLDSPYRTLLGTMRGAAGVQLRPNRRDYLLRLGPVLEGGLQSLNAEPAQSFLSQSRPYSFGLEVGVEFGRGTKAGKP